MFNMAVSSGFFCTVLFYVLTLYSCLSVGGSDEDKQFLEAVIYFKPAIFLFVIKYIVVSLLFGMITGWYV